MKVNLLSVHVEWWMLTHDGDALTVQAKLEELAQLKEKAAKNEELLSKTRHELPKAEAQRNKLQKEVIANQQELTRLQTALQEARKGRTEGASFRTVSML